MKKTKNILSPLFVIFCILLIFFSDFRHFAIYFVVVLVHELAHFFVSKKLGYKLNKLKILPYGVCLNYKDNVFAGNDEMYIAIAGPVVNFMLCAFCVALWWLFPETYYYLDYFCFCNIALGAFNLIPCFPLDGGRVLIATFSKKFDRERVIQFAVIFNYVISFILIGVFVFSFFYSVNYTYILTAIFLFSGAINPEGLSSYNYMSLGVNRKKIIKNGASIKIFAASSSTPIFKIISKFSRYKYNIVYVVSDCGAVKVLSESNINVLALKYSPSLSIEEIIYCGNKNICN